MQRKHAVNHARGCPASEKARTDRTELPDTFRVNASCSIRGFTFIELMLTFCIIGILSGIAVPAYSNHIDKVNRAQASADIADIGLVIDKYYAENNRYPDSLNDIGKGVLKDPWGRPYRYLNMANDPKQNTCRKLGPVHPLNTDYDLYSVGKDGKTNTPINSGPSLDDIVRAFNGSYVGGAQDII